MTDNENKYWAFLSYSPQDNCGQRADTPEVSRRCWGDWLHDALKTYSIPAEFVGQINGRGEIIPERIHPLFRADLEPSEVAGLSAEFRQALEQSICLIVICSPRSARSLQVNEAVRYFKQLGRHQHILPVVVAGEPNAGDGHPLGRSPDEECFVPALRHPVRPDGTLDITRRAAKFIFVDARHGVDKREILAGDYRNAEADLEMAKIQLIALLLGVGFNGLWWREQKRHFLDFAEARHQAREALSQVEETRCQLQEAQRQAREAQNQALEMQNLPREVHGQIQAAQNQALEAQHRERETQKQLQELQNTVRDTKARLEEARQRALAAESKVLEAQHQARDLQHQLAEAKNLAREVLAAQGQLETTRSQAQAADDQFLVAQSQVLEFQNQVRAAQNQLEEARQQVRAAQSQVLAAQTQAREAQNKFEEIQSQASDAQSQIEAARNQVREIQARSRVARRLTKVFAVLAVLASMAAGIALWQRQLATRALAQSALAETGKFDLVSGRVDLKLIRQVLQDIAGVEPARRLDQLAAWIPQAEISAALQASSVMVNDQQRSHFQKYLLVRLGWVDPVSALTCAAAIEGKIVNDEGLDDSCLYFQLAVLDNWMQTDLSGAFRWVCRLPDADSRQRVLDKIFPQLAAADPQNSLGWLGYMQPLPDERICQLLFQRVAGATNWVESLALPQGIMPPPRQAPRPWTSLLLNPNDGIPARIPVQPEILSIPANGPVQIKPQE